MLSMNDDFNFLAFGDGQEHNGSILIFADRKGEEALSSCTAFFMDGTFNTCSRQYYQIYVISADPISSSEEKN